MSKGKRQVAERADKAPPALQDSPSPAYALLAGAQVCLSAPGQYLVDAKTREMMMQGGYALYCALRQEDALHSMVAGLAVSVSNSAHDCLGLATRLPPENATERDLNFRLGLKAAGVALELIKELRAWNGEKSEKVTVGNVNVEAGGQAIVGTVEAPGPKGRQN